MQVSGSESDAALVIAYVVGKTCAACYAEMHAEEKAEDKRQEIKAVEQSEEAGFGLNPQSSESAKNLILSELSPEEEQAVDELKARDREVSDHEEAHARVGGPYAGEPSYTYQTGPDGKQYAIGGEVPIDVAPVEGDPEATIEKMEIVKAAALAPAEPSGQDRKVAALADAQRTQAMGDLAEIRQMEAQGIAQESQTGVDARL